MTVHNAPPSATTDPAVEPDEVVLLAEDGTPIGSADRIAVHTTDTPLHQAFSTYLFNARGQVLVTRRALSKKTWPGVWTNSCCGHPKPGESLEDAARRRIREELGLSVGPLTPLIPEFRYRAVDASGIVENEYCPVFAGFVADEDATPNPDEVAELAWVGWEDLLTAISATPHVYSPWAALQIPQIAHRHPDAAWSGRRPLVDPDEAVRDVDALLQTEAERLGDQWKTWTEGQSLDVLDVDLPGWFSDLLIGHGKRLRVQLAYWGFIAAGGIHGSAGYSHVVRVAAALETLHLFALIHDDIMDDSAYRRGRPAAHIEAATWHRQAGGDGDADHFGRSIAMLLGDFAHTVADRLVEDLPRGMRDVWYELCLELIAGQRADLTGSAARRRDRSHAEHVARVKSGRYTISRPLQLGATAAGAQPATIEALMRFGDLLGEAFALRDDMLGVWGDPDITGKPVGDDFLDAKATVLLCLAEDMVSGHGQELLARIGTPEFRQEDIADLAEAMRDSGVETEVEKLITRIVDQALETLESQPLSDAGLAGLRQATQAAAWRQR